MRQAKPDDQLKLTIPPIPRPSDGALLSEAIQYACLLLGDLPADYGMRALKAVDLVTEKGATSRSAAWAIWELVERGALIASARRIVDIVVESQDTISYVDDP